MDTVLSYQRRRKKEIWDIFLKAEVSALYFCGKEGQEPPHPWDYYPELFKDERAKYEETMQEKEFEEYKERKREYIEEMNRRRRET